MGIETQWYCFLIKKTDRTIENNRISFYIIFYNYDIIFYYDIIIL